MENHQVSDSARDSVKGKHCHRHHDSDAESSRKQSARHSEGKETGRPSTPLWKQYRWKAWALKKGLISTEPEQSKDARQSVVRGREEEIEIDGEFYRVNSQESEEEEDEWVMKNGPIRLIPMEPLGSQLSIEDNCSDYEDETEGEVERIKSSTSEEDRWLRDAIAMYEDEFPGEIEVPTVETIEGILPEFDKGIRWLPFCRFNVMLPHEVGKWLYCELDLETNSKEGIFMKIVNNDTHELVKMVSPTMYLGKLSTNRHGYTVLLYRWMKDSQTEITDVSHETHSHKWKLRLISPQTQKLIVASEGPDENEVVIPSKLVLYRFTDYYFPNSKNCVCRYTIETPANQITYLSLRFKPSCATAQMYLEIKDLNQDCILCEYRATGVFILPAVRLQGKDITTKQDPIPSQELLNIESGPEPEPSDNTEQLSSEPIAEAEPNENEKSSEPPIDEANENEKAETPSDELGEHERSSEPPATESAENENEPSVNPTQIQMQKYVISVYVKKGTWEFSHDDWNFIQREKSKFWKNLMVRRIPSALSAQVAKEELSEGHEGKQKKQKPQEEAKAKVAPSSEVSKKVEEKKGKKPRTKLKKQKARSDSDLQMKSSPLAKSNSITGKVQSAEPQPQHRGSKGEPPHAERKGRKLNSKGKPASLTEAHRVSEENHENEEHEHGSSDEEALGPDSYETSNVSVRFGGPHSIRIRNVKQPNWGLEILVTENQSVNIRSNRAMLQNYLEQKKAEWEASQAKRIQQGLGTLHHSKAVAPGTYVLSNPFVFVKLMTTLDISAYMNDDEFKRFTYGEEMVEEKKGTPESNEIVPTPDGLEEHAPTPPASSVSDLKIPSDTDLFPPPFAGSDFKFIPSKKDITIFPIDLSTGSPSYLEFLKLFKPDNLSASTPASAPGTALTIREEHEGEFEALWVAYQNSLRYYEECRGENEDMYKNSESEEGLGEDRTTVEVIGEGDHEGENGKHRKHSKHGMPPAHVSHPLDRKCTKLFGVSRNDNRKKTHHTPGKSQSAETLAKISDLGLEPQRKASLDANLRMSTTKK